MKKLLSIILAVTLIMGIFATMSVSADEKINIYYGFKEITDAKDFVVGERYLLIKDIKVEANQALLGLPEGSAEVKFAGTELNAANAEKAIPDYYLDEDKYVEKEISYINAYIEYYKEAADEYITLGAMTDPELQTYIEDNGITSFTLDEFRSYIEEALAYYDKGCKCYQEYLDLLNGDAKSVDNDWYKYSSREDAVKALLEGMESSKQYCLDTLSDISYWDNDGKITATDKMQAFFSINQPGDGFDTCSYGGIVWVEAEKCWYYGCYAGGVQDLAGFHAYSYGNEEVDSKDINIALKDGVVIDENTTLTNDMIDVSYTKDGKTYTFTSFNVLGAKTSDDGKTSTVAIEFAGKTLTFDFTIKEDEPESKVEPVVESKEETKAVNNDVPKTADNNVVLFAGIMALLSTTALVVLRKKD